jgi:hypothetical protein
LLSKAADFGAGDIVLLAQMREAYLRQATENPKTVTLYRLGYFISELNDGLTFAKDTDGRGVIEQMVDAIENQVDAGMREAGTSDEEIANVQTLRREDRLFHSTVNALDPRYLHFGTEVSDRLFGGAIRNPKEGWYFARMITEADRVTPGVKARFRQHVLWHFLAVARWESSGCGPIDEMRKFAALRAKLLGLGPEGHAFLEETFGKDSPMADSEKFVRIVGDIGKPPKSKEIRDASSQAEMPELETPFDSIISAGMGPRPPGIKGFLAEVFVDLLLLVGVINCAMMVERALHLSPTFLVESILFVAIGVTLTSALKSLRK